MHRRTEFTFQVDAPYDAVAPLFGAHEERRWVEGWAPRFVHPQPAHDVEGAVFVVETTQTVVWVNTIFDLAQGRVQYVNFNPEGVATRIDIQLTRGSFTHVRVVYERTAVSEAAADLVQSLAETDARKAPEWEAALTRCLKRGQAT